MLLSLLQGPSSRWGSLLCPGPCISHARHPTGPAPMPCQISPNHPTPHACLWLPASAPCPWRPAPGFHPGTPKEALLQGFMEGARRGLRPTEDQAGRSAVGCHPSRMAVPLLRVGSGGPGAKALCGPHSYTHSSSPPSTLLPTLGPRKALAGLQAPEQPLPPPSLRAAIVAERSGDRGANGAERPSPMQEGPSTSHTGTGTSTRTGTRAGTDSQTTTTTHSLTHPPLSGRDLEATCLEA